MMTSYTHTLRNDHHNQANNPITSQYIFFLSGMLLKITLLANFKYAMQYV